jgi:hypothetical protein
LRKAEALRSEMARVIRRIAGSGHRPGPDPPGRSVFGEGWWSGFRPGRIRSRAITFTSAKSFASISVGLGAKRLFICMVKSTKFPYQTFLNSIEPYIKLEYEESKEKELPRDGIGCWHPLFPARSDDIWLSASTAIKTFEQSFNSLTDEPQVKIFQQNFKDSEFIGFMRIM